MAHDEGMDKHAIGMDLFGELIFPEEPKRKRYEARGYYYPPGTGPEGETCGTCKSFFRRKMGNVYFKCWKVKHLWTGGPATDIRYRSPACSGWESKEEEDGNHNDTQG